MHFCCHLSKLMQSILGPTDCQQTTLKKRKLWRSMKSINNHIKLVYYIYSKARYFKKKPVNNAFLIPPLYGDFEWLKIIYHLWYYRRYMKHFIGKSLYVMYKILKIVEMNFFCVSYYESKLNPCIKNKHPLGAPFPKSAPFYCFHFIWGSKTSNAPYQLRPLITRKNMVDGKITLQCIIIFCLFCLTLQNNLWSCCMLSLVLLCSQFHSLRFSLKVWCLGWRSGWRYLTMSRTAWLPSASKILDNTQTSPACAQTPWNTFQTSSTRGRYMCFQVAINLYWSTNKR